jgi:hypothetical protein
MNVIAFLVFVIIVLILQSRPDIPHELITRKGGWFRGQVDVTDELDGRRSGLSIAVDYGTGVQYLVTGMGGITPRLDADGNVMKLPEVLQ